MTQFDIIALIVCGSATAFGTMGICIQLGMLNDFLRSREGKGYGLDDQAAKDKSA